jgi:hypothetical protein
LLPACGTTFGDVGVIEVWEKTDDAKKRSDPQHNRALMIINLFIWIHMQDATSSCNCEFVISSLCDKKLKGHKKFGTNFKIVAPKNFEITDDATHL